MEGTMNSLSNDSKVRHMTTHGNRKHKKPLILGNMKFKV